MKRLLFTALICAAATGVFAQNATPDSAKSPTVTDTTKKNNIKVGFGDEGTGLEVESHHHSRVSGFSIGLTLSRLDLGLTTLIDNGSFTLSEKNEFLRYRSWKSSNNGFDLFQFGYRFNESFKIYVSGGFDWTLIRLRENITILPNQPVLTYRVDTIDYSKNRFSATYLRIPLSFDFRSKEDADGRRFHFVIGPDIGLLLGGRVKQISDQFGKQKIDDDYHFTKMRYGGFFRVGYGAWGIFAKYYTSDMFENSPEQKGLKNFSFGIMLGF
jgi:hypothetical protein